MLRTIPQFTLLCSVACALASSLLHADTTLSPSTPPEHKEEPLPWLTGPLLTPSAHVVPAGHYNIEPYEYVTSNYGVYNQDWEGVSAPHNLYNVQTQVPIQIGILSVLDFVFSPQWSWNHIQGASSWALNDMLFGFDYQVLARKRHDWWPSIKLSTHATFPLGKYQKLNPHSKGTDLGGSGNWNPNIGLTMSHYWHLSGPVFLVPRCYVQYTVPNSVHVKGLNAYGGGHGTRGTAYPGAQWLAQLGVELSLPYHFALACDLQYQHINKTHFKGHKGQTDGVTNRVGPPSSEQFILAPAIEYNWSPNYGVIAGSQFTFAGRNAGELVSGVVAINIYH